MTQNVKVVGVDPGLVNSGVVNLFFVPSNRKLYINAVATPGNDADAIRSAVSWNQPGTHIFVEAYRPRQSMNSDPLMLALQGEVKRILYQPVFLPNWGIKKVVKDALLKDMKLLKFSTRTHHADLESAARIAILGMLKTPELNRVLTDFLTDTLSNGPWDILINERTLP